METPLAVPFTHIPTAEVIPLWPGFVPKRHVTLMVAPGGTGKGLLGIYMTSVVTTGAAWPGEPEGELHKPANVILVAPEDDPNEVVAWRLGSAHADNARVFNLTVLPDGSSFRLPRDVPKLRAAMAQIEEATGEPVDLVILDPLLSMLDKTASITNNAHAREIIDPLEKLAQDTDSAIVLTHHTVKSGATAGSKGLTDAVRLVLRISAPDQRTELTRRIRELSIDKANNQGDGGTLRYVMLGDDNDVRIAFPATGDNAADARGYLIREPDLPSERDVRLIHTVSGGRPEVIGNYASVDEAKQAAERVAKRGLPWKPGVAPGTYHAFTGGPHKSILTFTILDLTAATTVEPVGEAA